MSLSYARQMLDSSPRTVDVDASVLAAAIDAISDCAQACTADTDADLGEQNLASSASPAAPSSPEAPGPRKDTRLAGLTVRMTEPDRKAGQ